MNRSRLSKTMENVSERITMPQRMVALAFVVVATLFAIALTHQIFFSSIDKKPHLDENRLTHFKALLDTIRPVDTLRAPLPPVAQYETCAKLKDIENLHLNIEELDRRLLEMTQGASPFLSRHYKLDAGMWLQNAAPLQGGCEKASQTLSYLLWTDPKRKYKRDLLQGLEWRERIKRGQWQNQGFGDDAHVAIRSSSFTTANPWANLPGCVLLSRNTDGQDNLYRVNGTGMGRVCGNVVSKDANGEPLSFAPGDPSVPRNLSLLANDINAWRIPDSIVYQNLINEPNVLDLPGGKQKPIGLHPLFTFDPTLQRNAQNLVKCYAGDIGACKDSGLSNPGQGMIDEARVRQVGLAVIDVATGEIQVAASAESACYTHDIDSKGARPSNCPDFGQIAREHLRRDDNALLNHALFSVAPPGSTIKPIMLAGFLNDRSFRQSDDTIRQAMRKSNSALFLDWLFCREGSGQGCQRTKLTQDAAHSLGWNAGCDSGLDCGLFDVLRGRQAHHVPQGFNEIAEAANTSANFDPARRIIQLGRLLVGEHDAMMRDLAPSDMQPDRQLLAKCAAQRYSACQGRGMATVSEGLGQGNARATPVGVAAMIAQLASISGHGKAMRHPHIIKSLLNVEGMPDPAANPQRWGIALTPVGIDQMRATRVLKAMSEAHHAGGTASKGCEIVLGSNQCSSLPMASKTGTTTFGSELATSGGYRNAWAKYETKLTKYRNCIDSGASVCTPPPAPPHRPWRWYTAAYKSSPDAKGFDKVFAVLVERNWEKTGSIDLRGGEARNSAAVEIGLRFIQATALQPAKANYE